MARRFSAPYQSEPVSSLATWARNLAVFSVVAVAVSMVILWFDFLEIKEEAGVEQAHLSQGFGAEHYARARHPVDGRCDGRSHDPFG